MSKAWKTPLLATHFEFRSKPSLITVICMDPHSPNKLFATKYCFLILGDEFRFLNHFFIFRVFFFWLFYVILLLLILTKNNVIIIILLIEFFFHENYFYFFMFADVPACSGMFQNVPCSDFMGPNEGV